MERERLSRMDNWLDFLTSFFPPFAFYLSLFIYMRTISSFILHTILYLNTTTPLRRISVVGSLPFSAAGTPKVHAYIFLSLHLSIHPLRHSAVILYIHIGKAKYIKYGTISSTIR